MNIVPQKTTLMQIGADGMALDQLIEEYAAEHEGDLTEIAPVIDAWLDENATQLQVKLEGYAAVIREYEARAAARKTEAQRMAALAQADTSQAQHLKDRLKWFFEARGILKIETATAKISLANNGGKLPVILTDDLDVSGLPERFQRIHIEADKTAIYEALEAGEDIEFARFGERGKSLRIR